MRPKQPSAVIIHGHHLQAPGWETLVWGTPDLARVGRMPRGLEIAVKEDAQIIIWGTGASHDPETGKCEAEFTRDFALAHTAELAAYLQVDEAELTSLLTERSVLQLDTKNTKDETHEALKLCQERGINTLYLVSTPTHVPRCLLTAVQFQDEFPNIVLCGVAAETSLEYWHPKDVAIVEPAHRPDRDTSPMNLLAKRMARARKDKRAPKLYEDIARLMDEFENSSS